MKTSDFRPTLKADEMAQCIFWQYLTPDMVKVSYMNFNDYATLYSNNVTAEQSIS